MALIRKGSIIIQTKKMNQAKEYQILQIRWALKENLKKDIEHCKAETRRVCSNRSKI